MPLTKMKSDPDRIEGLVRRLAANPGDEDALLETDRLAATDPRAHALLLERVGNATDPPPVACLWLARAAAVWSGTLQDSLRAARVLAEAIHRDPTQRAAIRQLAQLRDSEGGSNELVGCIERCATARGVGGGSSLAARTELAALQTIWTEGDRGETYERLRCVLTNDHPSPETLAWAKDQLRAECNYEALCEVLRIAAATSTRTFEERREDLRELGGLCWNKLCDAEGAIDAWKKVVALDLTDGEAQQCLVNLLEDSGRWDDLALLFERSAEVEGDVRKRMALLRRIAELHEGKTGDLRAAAEAWADIARLDPEREDAIHMAAALFERAHAPGCAARAIAQSLESLKDSHARAELLERLGELRERLADPAGAAEAYAEAAEITGSVRLWQAVERCSVTAKSWNRAAQAAVMVAVVGNERGDRAPHLVRAAEHLGAAGDQEGSLFHLELAVEIDPSLAPRLTDVYAASSRWRELVDLVEDIGTGVSDAALRVALRRAAANACSVHLADAARAREMWHKLLEDGDDREALERLLEDAIDRDDRAGVDSLIPRLSGLKLESNPPPAARATQVTLIPMGDDDVIDASDFAELVDSSSVASEGSQASI